MTRSMSDSLLGLKAGSEPENVFNAITHVFFPSSSIRRTGDDDSTRLCFGFNVRSTTFGPRIVEVFSKAEWEEHEIRAIFHVLRWGLFPDTDDLSKDLEQSWEDGAVETFGCDPVSSQGGGIGFWVDIHPDDLRLYRDFTEVGTVNVDAWRVEFGI